MDPRTALLFVVVAATGLAGCAAPVAPDHATTDDHPGLPGVTIAGWSEDGDGFVRIHGLFHNDAGKALVVYQGHHLGAWNLTIQDPFGAPVIYESRLSCRDLFYDFLADGAHDEMRFSWTYKAYNEFAHCKSDDRPEAHRAAPGEYTATLQYWIQDQPEDALEVTFPIRVPAAEQADDDAAPDGNLTTDP